MAKRSRNSIDDTSETTSVEMEYNTSSHLICPLKPSLQYLGNKTVNIYSSCDFGASEDHHSSPSQSPVKGGKRYRFTSTIKRVDKISKGLNLCVLDHSEDIGAGEEITQASKSF